MYRTILRIGNTSTLIVTHPSCVDEPSSLIGEPKTIEKYDFLCFILPEGQKKQMLDLQCKILYTHQFEGMYKKFFLTYMFQYGLVAETNLTENIIRIYLLNRKLNWKSHYLIRSIIKKHILRLVFGRGDAPIHAAALYINNLQCGMIIIGKNGAGKSSMVWKLVNSMDALLVADDTSIISKENGCISGDGGSIYVRPDFVQRYKIPKSQYRIVSAGRKIEIPFAPSSQMQFVPKYLCFVNSMYYKDMQLASVDYAVDEIEHVHCNWCYNKYEKDIYIRNVRLMLSNIVGIYNCNLEDENIDRMIKIILSQ